MSNLSCSAGCRNELHIDGLDAIYEKFCDLLVDVAKHIYVQSGSASKRNIPGWNSLVKEPDERSRCAFRAWRQAGSPRFGPAAEDMSNERARFKLSLRQCRLGRRTSCELTP